MSTYYFKEGLKELTAKKAPEELTAKKDPEETLEETVIRLRKEIVALKDTCNYLAFEVQKYIRLSGESNGIPKYNSDRRKA